MIDIIQQLVKLVKINTRISSLHSSRDIIKEIMNEAMSLSATTSAFVLQVSPRREIVCLEQHYLLQELRINWSSSSALEAHDRQRLVYSTNAKETSTRPSIVSGSIQTLISLPLASEPQGTLLLQLAGQDAAAIDPQTISLLTLFASQVQVTITKTRLEESVLTSARLTAAGEVASQVAHDIRSPLAALEVVSRSVDQLPEDKRMLIRSAVDRIRDIANNLLDRQRAQVSGSSVKSEAASPQLLSSLLDPVVSEKRLQFHSQSRVEIEPRLDPSSYGLFAIVQPIEFKRLISNLVNNAVESFGDAFGAVSVSLSSRDGHAVVSVQDDGKGIPPEILARLGQRGETHGKAGGTGLGLYHARTCVESWGGRLDIASEVGKGTTVTLTLPLAPAPDWFVAELALHPGRAVMILDDDPTIHQVWQGRLDALKAGAQGVEIAHASTPRELRDWVQADPAKAREALYLLDYELAGHAETGLSLAEELAIGAQAILVTSRYEEPAVLEGCRRLKARLIPKGLAGQVPLRVETAAAGPGGERWDAVLIDDDELARATWRMAASRSGKRLRVFATPAEFFQAAAAIDRRTPVYVDSELGAGVQGGEESRRVHEMGFSEVYLATGHEPGKFAGLSHLRGVIGKAPPWG